MGEALDLVGDACLLHGKLEFILRGDGLLRQVDVDRHGGHLAVFPAVQLMGEDAALQTISDIIVGGLKNIDRDAACFQYVAYLVEDGDAEGDLLLAVQFFHFIGIFDEKPFVVGEKGDDFDMGTFRCIADLMKGELEIVHVIHVGRDFHRIAGDFGAEEQAKKSGGGAGDGDPFRIVRDGFFRIEAGCISQKEKGIYLTLTSADEIRDIDDGLIREGDGGNV